MDLPNGIYVERRGNAYVVFRNKHEELGGVVVSGTVPNSIEKYSIGTGRTVFPASVSDSH